MDLMDDEDLKKSVIDQMMGELDDVTADSLKKKPDAPVKGVEIAITVSPKSEEEMPDEECDEEGCMDPAHNHEHEAVDEVSEGDHDKEDDYISQLMKKMG
jgi:hypothetical protein